MLVDAAGRHFEPCAAPRIVSLVPSLTELVADLGLADRLVGRTGFCIHPRAVVKAIPKVGGTKDVKLDRLRALAPTHVLVNVDENRREDVEAMRAFVPEIVVTHPLRPEDNRALYRLLGGLFDVQARAEALERELDAALGEIRAAARGWPREEVLYVIWRKPWMTVSRATYISAMLAEAGWDTLPAASDARYPVFDFGDGTTGGTRRVLLSTEPYRFRDRDVEEVRALPALRGAAVQLIDGEMVSWYGSRAIAGLRYLHALRATLMPSIESRL